LVVCLARRVRGDPIGGRVREPEVDVEFRVAKGGRNHGQSPASPWSDPCAFPPPRDDARVAGRGIPVPSAQQAAGDGRRVSGRAGPCESRIVVSQEARCSSSAPADTRDPHTNIGGPGPTVHSARARGTTRHWAWRPERATPCAGSSAHTRCAGCGDRPP